MKVDYISDLHLDFWIRELNPQSPKFQKQIDEYLDMIHAKGGDVLIIAGDLGHYFQQDSAFLLACKELYRHVMLVRGNHDMYLIGNGQEKKYLKDSMNRVLEMKRFCRETEGLHYLDGDVICIDGYNFGGVGMSWDKTYYEKLNDEGVPDSVIQEFFNNTMNDSRLIFQDGKPNMKVPTAYGGSYFQSGFDPFDYFKKEYAKLQQINDYDNVDIMVTHYTPISPYDYVDNSKYEDEESSTFYMFNGHKDIERINAKYWIFGHMHNNYDFIDGDTNFLCNPLGYPGENTYSIVKTIEL